MIESTPKTINQNSTKVSGYRHVVFRGSRGKMTFRSSFMI